MHQLTCLFIYFNLFTVRHPSERTTSASRSSRTGKRQSQAHEKRRRDTLMLFFWKLREATIKSKSVHSKKKDHIKVWQLQESRTISKFEYSKEKYNSKVWKFHESGTISKPKYTKKKDHTTVWQFQESRIIWKSESPQNKDYISLNILRIEVLSNSKNSRK